MPKSNSDPTAALARHLQHCLLRIIHNADLNTVLLVH